MSKELIKISFTGVQVQKNAVYFTYANKKKTLMAERSGKSLEEWQELVNTIMFSSLNLIEKGGLEVNVTE